MRNNNSIFETLKNIDLLDINFYFYTDKKRNFTTKLGGSLTLLWFISGLFTFIYINYDDFLHNNPISTISTSKLPYRNVKFLEEKLWIPWRIRDYRARAFNFTGVLYPIVYYYQTSKNIEKNALDLSSRILDYKLCNETSMVNYTNSFILDIELEKLYCIEMDYINMGGGWDTEFINYVEFDLFTCADGIDYDENNINCSTYEHIMEAAGEDNSFSMDVYYPVVHYQPLNKTNPIFVRYDNFFYHLSRFSNKIDRIYLQQHILKDDDGLLTNNEKNISFWGVMSLSGDDYANGEGKDLMNEGSFSRLYSFNIYLNFDVIYYHRYYKKLFFIIADGLPFVTGIFSICEIIAKILKISSENEKLIELLFEERQTHESKSIKIENNILEMNQSNNIIENKDISRKDIIYINSPKNQNKRIFQNFQNKNQMISKLNNSNLSSSKLILPNKDRHFTARNNKQVIENNRYSNQINNNNINKGSKMQNYSYIIAYNNLRILSNRKKK